MRHLRYILTVLTLLICGSTRPTWGETPPSGGAPQGGAGEQQHGTDGSSKSGEPTGKGPTGPNDEKPSDLSEGERANAVERHAEELSMSPTSTGDLTRMAKEAKAEVERIQSDLNESPGNTDLQADLINAQANLDSITRALEIRGAARDTTESSVPKAPEVQKASNAPDPVKDAKEAYNAALKNGDPEAVKAARENLAKLGIAPYKDGFYKGGLTKGGESVYFTYDRATGKIAGLGTAEAFQGQQTPVNKQPGNYVSFAYNAPMNVSSALEALSSAKSSGAQGATPNMKIQADSFTIRNTTYKQFSGNNYARVGSGNPNAPNYAYKKDGKFYGGFEP